MLEIGVGVRQDPVVLAESARAALSETAVPVPA